MIEKGQALVQTLTSELNAIEFARGRILFAISREDYFKGIGYANGVYGLIGEFSHTDQCANTSTLYSNFLRNSPTVEVALSRLIANLELTQLTQKMISSSGVDIWYPQSEANETDAVLRSDQRI